MHAVAADFKGTLIMEQVQLECMSQCTILPRLHQSSSLAFQSLFCPYLPQVTVRLVQGRVKQAGFLDVEAQRSRERSYNERDGLLRST